MPQKSTLPFFYQNDLGLLDFITNPDISDDIQQTLSRILGWDYENNQWRRAKLDSLGRFVVATGTGTFNTFGVTKVVVALVEAAILNSNSARNQFVLKNLGPSTVYINAIGGVTANDYPLSVGESFSIDSYTGPIKGICTAGSADIRIIEV